MSNIIKAMLAEFSYFLEKYIDQTSILWSLIFVGFCCAVLFSITLKIVSVVISVNFQPNSKNLNKVMTCIYFASTFICSCIADDLSKAAYTWDSKLHRVMSNFEYMLSFTSNRDIFTNALNIADTTRNNDNLFKIAMYLNDKQWNTVFNSAGNSSWYFEKVYKAISDILRIGDYNLSLNVMYQGILAYIPAIIIFAVIVMIYLKISKEYKKYVFLLLIFIAICPFFSLGANIFMCVMLCSGTCILSYAEKICENAVKRFEKQPS